MKSFLHSLNPTYKPPSRQALAKHLLDEVYSDIKTRTDTVISSIEHINISTDESTNINANRICNISIHSKYGAFHYVSENIHAKRMTAPVAVAWLRDHLLTLSHQRLDRINSISTDTCATMRRMWIEIEKFEDLKHCFFIPCDSHGIQLLVKDVMTLIPSFNETIQQAQCIVKSFRHAPLQYARLCEFQMQYYGKHQSLVLSVITRWGTQYLLILSVLKNKDAIKRYASEFQSHPTSERLKQEALDTIMDWEMWGKLEALHEVLNPLMNVFVCQKVGNLILGMYSVVGRTFSNIYMHKAKSIKN